jgi:hypothetical protein
MLAAHQASLTVSGVPVRIHRRRTEDTQAAVVLDDAHHPVVGDVAEEQIMPGAEIRGSLGPAETGGDPLDGACANAAFEPLVQGFNVGVGIAGARQRTERKPLGGRHRHGRRRRSERSLGGRGRRP